MDPLQGFVLHLSLEIGCKVAWTEGQGSGWWPNGKPLLFLVSLSVSLMFFFHSVFVSFCINITLPEAGKTAAKLIA